jgi:arylsulfatase A-like enzyme
VPGHAPVQAILTSPQLDLPTYPRTPGLEDTWTTTLALKFLFKYHPRLLMVNLPEVDTFGHVVGTDASVMGPLMANVDHNIGRLLAAYTRAGMISQTTFVVTADHAMIPALHTVSSQLVERIIQQGGGQPLYVGHGDYCPIWLKDPASIPRVAAALSRANIPDVSAVYDRNPKGQYVLVSPVSRLADPGVHQAYADLLSTINSPASPDIVLLYDENTITMTPGFLKINRQGDHGGATWGAQHIPLIMAGPGVKAGYSSLFPARLVDLAPTLETLMGGKPARQDGVVLADAMTHPPVWAVTAQNRSSLRLSGDVAALEHEAAVRPNSRR